MDSWSSPETAERILAHLSDLADERGRVARSGRQLATELPGLSYSTALRGLARLTSEGAIRVLRRGSTGRHPTVIEVLRAPDLEVAERYAPVA